MDEEKVKKKNEEEEEKISVRPISSEANVMLRRVRNDERRRRKGKVISHRDSSKGCVLTQN